MHLAPSALFARNKSEAVGTGQGTFWHELNAIINSLAWDGQAVPAPLTPRVVL